MTLALGPGERLLWQGVPAQGLRLTHYDLFLIPFALIWVVTAVATIAIPLANEKAPVDPVSYPFFTLFLLIGLYLLIGRFFVDRAARRRTRYYLTSRRAVIENGLLRATRRSVNLAAAAEIRYRQGRNGRGTIHFGLSSPFFMPTGWPGASAFQPPAFEGIDGAEQVYELALDAQRQNGSSS